MFVVCLCVLLTYMLSTHVLYACLDFPTLGIMTCDTKKRPSVNRTQDSSIFPEIRPNTCIFSYFNKNSFSLPIWGTILPTIE